MLQLENQTPFKATIAVLPDRGGIDTLYVIVKATLALRPKLSLAKEQAPLTLADEYYGEAPTSSLRYSTEMHLGKTGTDVLLIGSARAPGGRPVKRMQVSLAIAERRKTIFVTGDRVWRNGQPTDPQPFEAMPLIWERAFGGFYHRGEKMVAEERNPIGRGFAGGRSAEEMQGLPLPNLEDPAAPLAEIGQTPAPACMAPIAPSWLPRRAFAGTYDERWQRTRAPYLPEDFDPRFFQSASPDLTFDRFLQGGEAVRVDGVTPDSPLEFAVPEARLNIAVTIAGSPHTPPAHLETLLIEPDNGRACLTWRAAVPCDRKALSVDKILVSRSGGRS